MYTFPIVAILPLLLTMFPKKSRGGEPIVRVTLGISFCNNKDQFKKVLGRKIAEGRLAKSTIEFSYKYNREENPGFGKTLSREVANFVRSNSFGLSLQVSQ